MEDGRMGKGAWTLDVGRWTMEDGARTTEDGVCVLKKGSVLDQEYKSTFGLIIIHSRVTYLSYDEII